MPQMYDYTCKHCDTPFQSRRKYGTSHAPNYCSRKCSDLSRRTRRKTYCAFCNQLFYPDKDGRIYCSHECFNSHRTEQAYVKCPVCGKEFLPAKRKIKHCSSKCYGMTMLAQTPRKGKNFRSAVRKFIKERDGYQCVKCSSKKKLEVDHIKPAALGGTNHPDNGQTLCRACHLKKTRKDRVEIRKANKQKRRSSSQ